FLRDVVSDHRDDPALVSAGEQMSLGVPGLRLSDPVAAALQYDRGHLDRWLRGEALLDLFEIGIARGIAEAVPVGVNDDIDEIRVVERGRRALVGRIVKLPVRRPELPQQLAE